MHFCADEAAAVVQAVGMSAASWRVALAAISKGCRRLRHVLCSMAQCDEHRRFAADRCWLQCGNCGYESEGWRIGR